MGLIEYARLVGVHKDRHCILTIKKKGHFRDPSPGRRRPYRPLKREFDAFPVYSVSPPASHRIASYVTR
ncbi:hypothetical protein HMPREF9004_1847 [Schaalia cardiffensis F0333]|uniref:Uncharacterized protein n=1 Tax=Schaalia cardiffensis F0333 TaxID=888050 RepID=N6X0W7_9ACTO|nr:hypothetical protein HMPREF9004_1847 [Schaalia cardiffensis F0333]